MHRSKRCNCLADVDMAVKIGGPAIRSYEGFAIIGFIQWRMLALFYTSNIHAHSADSVNGTKTIPCKTLYT